MTTGVPALAPPPGLGLADCRDGPMLYPSRDRYVGRSLALYGEYSPGEARLLRQLVRPGAVVVEAGANIGALTLPLARMVGAEGAVWAFEPQRLIHQVLCANLVMNGIASVRAERVALGAEAGETRVPCLSIGQAANFGGVAVGGAAGEPCPVRPLDSYDLPGPALLKIDVEGAEAAVIDGARGHIAAHRPALYVENDRRDKGPALIRQIQGLGYRLWWHQPYLFAPDNYRRSTENVFGGLLSRNMLCLPVERRTEVAGLVEITDPDLPPP